MTLNLDAMHETICDNFTGMAEVQQAADALIAEVRSLRANWRMVTTALGYGDGITEPQIEHRDFVAECERQFAEASEWRESQRWRDECHEAGHPDDEDCYEHDPVLALVALRVKLAAVEAKRDEFADLLARALPAVAALARVEALGDSNPDHADTCGSMLTPGAGYPCSCWQADIRAALAATGEGQ
ncbi:MAG TPA: hypothetical protein PKW13_12350 [Rhodoglobus sp.]|nr:hypothetical protein [Rhodoglobus sp.]